MRVFSTEHLNKIFAEEGKFDAVKNLMFDMVDKKELFDADGNVISAQKADSAVKKVIFEILGIDENASKRDRNRALKRHGYELFEVIEDTIDRQINRGFQSSEWFNGFVEQKNLKAGDKNEFWTEDNTMLSVAKVEKGNHDLYLQRLGQGKSYSVTTSDYVVAIGADIDLYLRGVEDFSKMIEKIAEAYLNKVQGDMLAQVMGVGSVVPVPDVFHGEGVLDNTTKDAFDQLIEDIAGVNNSGVYIIGTKTALKKLSNLTDVNWRSVDAKSDVYRMGRLGTYEGTMLMEVPQRFDATETFEGATINRLVRNDRLLIMPMSGDKFVKFVDVGETEIIEKNEKGQRQDDTMKYEAHREMGVGVQLGRYFGVWDIAAANNG